MNCIETNTLEHRYANGEPALRGIDLRVPYGSIYGFLGPNGAGKTTTLRLLLGLLRLQRGSIEVFGRSIAVDRVAILSRVGSLIETPSLYDHLTARENLQIWQRVHRVPPSRIDDVLTLVGLTGTGKKKTRQFSLGMKQRLSLAIALLHQPELLILDEPTNGLDPNGIVEMRDLLVRLSREREVTIVISSHLLAEVERLVTHVGIIAAGSLMFQGTMDELRRKEQQIHAVHVATDDDAAAIRLLLPQHPSARVSDGRIVLPPLGQQQVADLNHALVTSGRRVHELRAVRDDLETIFMNLVGSGAR